MSSRNISLGTPYRWLGEAFAMFRAHTGVLFGAAFLAALVALVPSVLQVAVELALTPSAAAGQMIELLCLLLGLVLFPPVVGGFYRILHALQAGRAVSALDVFAVFQDGPAAIRLIITNLVFTVVTLALAFAIAYAVGGPELFDFLRALATLKPDTATLPALPGGLFSTFALVLAVGMLVGTAQGLAMVQTAVAGSAPAVAIGEGFKAMLRNIGALLLFYLPVALIGGVIFLIVALLGAVLGMLSPALTMAVALPLALVLMLVLYAVFFSFIYHAWRELLGAAPPTPTDTQIAV